MKDVVVGFYRFILWTCFVLSLVSIPLREHGQQLSETSDYLASLAGSNDPREREARYLRRLAHAVNPYGLAPLLMVLSAGFLALIETQRRNAESIIAAITAGPDATAAAIRRAVRPSAPAPASAPATQVNPRVEAAIVTAMARPPKPPAPTPVPVPEPDDSNYGVLDDSEAAAWLEALDHKAKPLRRAVTPATAKEAL